MTTKACWLVALILGLMLVASHSDSAAEQKPPTPPDKKPAAPHVDKGVVDQHLDDFLRDAINQGANLYNNGDSNACYQLFRSALVSTWYMVDHHPSLRKDINAALEKAAGQKGAADQAYTLRTALDATRTALAKTKKAAPVSPTVAQNSRPLWDRLGGENAVRRVVDELVTRAAGDPQVNLTRKGIGKEIKLDDARLAEFKNNMVEFISSVTGGPLEYNGLSMKKAHLGMGISDAEFDALAADLKQILDKGGVAPTDRDELMQKLETMRRQIVEKSKPASTKPSEKKSLATQPEKKASATTSDLDPPAKPTVKKPGANADKTPTSTGEVSGAVTMDGKPLGDAKIVFVPDKDGEQRYRALTTAEGKYAISDVRPGSYKIVVTGNEKLAVPAKYSDETKTTLTIDLRGGKQVMDLNLK